MYSLSRFLAWQDYRRPWWSVSVPSTSKGGTLITEFRQNNFGLLLRRSSVAFLFPDTGRSNYIPIITAEIEVQAAQAFQEPSFPFCVFFRLINSPSPLEEMSVRIVWQLKFPQTNDFSRIRNTLQVFRRNINSISRDVLRYVPPSLYLNIFALQYMFIFPQCTEKTNMD